ncbi:MAG: ABC transporter ATP-binding protein [Actinomycetia bacterium]|nr:ABC transporter ATP-binding protein [Actinomycetes bacterium]MCP4958605.1 ABC transporter ATP-binding protein [Actinomycetes bacterium]
MTPVLRLDGVEKSYPGSPPVHALAGVDLEIRTGELVAIVGPSGSGKSTMLNMMGALDRPTAGSVWVEGRNLSTLSDRRVSSLRGRRIGFVFQQFHLIGGISCVDNVATGLLYQGVLGRGRKAAAIEMLERVGLGHRLSNKPNQLSGGERQRVAIARALLGDPAIVLADEPTGNLDSRTSTEIIDLMHELHEQGSTIVVITHDRELAASMPRTVALLDGRVEHDSALATR